MTCDAKWSEPNSKILFFMIKYKFELEGKNSNVTIDMNLVVLDDVGNDEIVFPERVESSSNVVEKHAPC